MFILPEKCLRGLKTCQPLSQIVSDNCKSFFCCGENDGSTTEIKGDKYTLCFKNSLMDDINHNEKRDLIHLASIIIQALAIIEEEEL